MDYEAYRQAYYVDPQPTPRFNFKTGGAVLYYQDYAQALAFYTQVLGPPAYVEGENTRGWPVGDSWLTLFPAKQGNPRNLEVPYEMQTPADVDAFYNALVAAGGQGSPPEDGIMYWPVRLALVTDPFGVSLLLFAKREI